MQAPPTRWKPQLILVYAVTGALAACSILYELSIAQTLSLLASNTVVWYSVTVGIFLGAMGVGSFLARPAARRAAPWRALLFTEITLALTGALVVPAIHAGHMIFGYAYIWGSYRGGSILFFAVAFACAFAVGLLTGMELPFCISLANQTSPGRDHTSGVLGADYLGSLAGAVSFPLLLLPRLELISIGLLTAAVNLGVAAAILLSRREPRRAPALDWVAAGALVAGLALGLAYRTSAQSYFLKKFYYYAPATSDLATLFAPMEDYPEIERASSPYQKIDLMEEVHPGPGNALIRAYSSKPPEMRQEKNHILFLNHDYQTSMVSEELYHEYFAHVPIMSLGRVPRRVLVLGAGDGLLIRELLKYEGVRKIVHVELDPAMAELATNHPVLTWENQNSLLDPRVETRIGDAYTFARYSPEVFDCAYIDFPMAADYNLAKLYSREFYQFVAGRISDDGFVVFDSPGLGLLTVPDVSGSQELIEGNDWPVYYHTLRKAGYKQIIPYLTTLEVDMKHVAGELSEEGIPLSLEGAAGALLHAVRTPQERDILIQIAFRRTLLENVETYQQGFIMLSKRRGLLEPRFRDFGIPLYILNRQRFDLAFSVEFPRSVRIDESKVNSIMRPTFPTLPVWDARLPY